ncbi:MAG: hypothetical protein M1820_010777 [Bogoriella megaspora]|nr:MAG: hypothetical protein M1820_010777 [Bogoriella megaspora]
MSSIGRVVLSGASASQEATLALMNANFDFSIVKVEVPIEYQGVGNQSSRRRRQAAEDGQVHVTARKLGALLADELPQVPNLIRAYGERASEVAKGSSTSPADEFSAGLFGSHLGVDATSIWAAATSGRGAIQVHLLACLLARVWSGPEATSVWVEIVETRRAFLKEQIRKSEEISIAAITASQIDISREKLAEWDASARSWIRSADKAKSKQQKQPMLILDNVGLSVPSYPRVYEGVLEVWTKSLAVMDLLKDKLISQGGLVTIGLQTSDLDPARGITWTMPLAHLRYYGKPVVSHRTVGSSPTRVPFQRIVHAALGSTISKWGQYGYNMQKVCQVLIAFADVCEKAPHELKWSQLFKQEAIAYLEASLKEQKETLRFVDLGRRRCGIFLTAEECHPEPVFGLSTFHGLLTLLDTEGQIKAIRQLATTYDIGVDFSSAVILYSSFGDDESDEFAPAAERRSFPFVEFATVCPVSVSNESKPVHGRWILPRDVTQGPDGVFVTEKADLATIVRSENVEFRFRDLEDSFTWIPQVLTSESDGNLGHHFKQNTAYHPIFRSSSMLVYQPIDKYQRISLEMPLDFIIETLRSTPATVRGPVNLSDGLESYYNSLTTLYIASEIFEKLPAANVNLYALSFSLYRRLWTYELRAKSAEPTNISRRCALACVTFFDSGYLSLEPELFNDVMAVSNGDTLYVSELLLADPSAPHSRGALRCFTGNIGKPGIPLLLSSRDLLLREPELDAWKPVNHYDFDGEIQDNFRDTSLHLSLTGYELQI